MLTPEIREFLSHGTRTAKLGFVAADGRPLVAPVWFVVEGDELWFNTGGTTAKGRAIARDPRLVLCVDIEQPPYAYVIPAEQPDMTRVAQMLDLLRMQGIEIGRATGPVSLKEGNFPAGSFIIKRNQPYGRLAKTLLEKQDYPKPEKGAPQLRTYDDSAAAAPPSPVSGSPVFPTVSSRAARRADYA